MDRKPTALTKAQIGQSRTLRFYTDAWAILIVYVRSSLSFNRDSSAYEQVSVRIERLRRKQGTDRPSIKLQRFQYTQRTCLLSSGSRPAIGYNGLGGRCLRSRRGIRPTLRFLPEGLKIRRTARRGTCLVSRCATGWRIGERSVLELRFWTVLHYFRMLDDPPRRKTLQQGIHGKECEISLQRVYKAQISSTRKDGAERSCLPKRLHSSARG